jgi:hypothetical protein
MRLEIALLVYAVSAGCVYLAAGAATQKPRIPVFMATDLQSPLYITHMRVSLTSTRAPT